jgi:predicted nucleic acid-binding Zn ribbon protein
MNEGLSRQPKKINGFVTEILRQIGLENEYYLSILRVQWLEIVGESIARACRIISLNKGKLLIETDNATWRTEIKLRKEKIISQLNESVGKQIIWELVIK